MAQIDKVKEQINFLKFWLSLVMASVLVIVGFCVTGYTKIDVWFLLLCLACIALGVFIIPILAFKVLRELR